MAVKRSTRDDASKVTSRTKRSHKTKQSSRSRNQQQQRGPPPRELELATIPQQQQEDPPEESVANGGVVVGRDPTMYQENSSQLDPEGDKLSKKKSMFASGALMDEVHRERDQQKQSSSKRRGNMNRRKSMDKLVSSFRWAKKQPTEYTEGAIVAVPEPPEEYDTDYSNKNNNNNRSRSKPSNRNNNRVASRSKNNSMGDRLRASLNWKKHPIDIDMDDDELPGEDCPQIDLEVGSCDSPSILTNHNPGDGDLPRDRNPYQRDATNEDCSGYEDSYSNKKKKSTKKKKKSRDVNDGNRKAGGQKGTAGALRKFRKSISWGDGRDADDDSYDRD